MKACYKISVVVTVYNTAKYLMQCVESLLAQKDADMDIWLVDDGSGDGSAALCDELAAGHPEIRVIHKENGGLISAWKCGVNACDGKYVAFVDSDDWVAPQMLSEMREYLTGSDQEIIAGDYVIERSDGSQQYIYQKQEPGEYNRERIERDIIPNLLGNEHRRITISRCMKLISRQLILRNQHFSDERIRTGEDATIMLPALIRCHRLVVLDRKAYYHYRYVDDSMIHRYDAGLYENLVLLRKCVQHILQETCSGDRQLYQEMLYKADQEHVFMLLLALKNEARGNPQGYLKNIRAMAADAEVKALVENTGVTLEETSNRLLYCCLKKPNRLRIRVLRLAMVLYDRNRN